MQTLKKGSIKKTVLAATAALSIATSLASPSAYAQHEHPGIFHGDIAHFHEHDWVVWRGGHWIHDWHDGRMGWWWVAGGIWYFYPAPVYPWPNPWEPPVEVDVTSSITQVSPRPATRSWYFCDATQKYYPYAASCPSGWGQVPATRIDGSPVSPTAPITPTPTPNVPSSAPQQ